MTSLALLNFQARKAHLRLLYKIPITPSRCDCIQDVRLYGVHVTAVSNIIYHHCRSQISPDSHRYLNIPLWPATAGGGFLQVPRGLHLAWTRHNYSICL